MKTFFQYGDLIKSHDMNLALSTPIGVGPICGFGYATFENDGLVLHPTPPKQDKPGILNMIDRIHSRRFIKPSERGETPETNFSCIAGDGALFTSDALTITIPSINGTRGSFKEVAVFAVHTPIEEPVENPVNFIACWNESSTEFYEIYRRSLDVYYPMDENTREYDVIKHSAYQGKFNYTALTDLVKSACPYFKANFDYAVLIGIYGVGTNTLSESNPEDPFAIVPYNGNFPQPLPYNTMERSNLYSSISNLEKVIEGFSSVNIIKDYIDSRLKSMEDELTERIKLSILPVGSIILWQGDKIPKGWAEYTKASGRVVIGYTPGGNIIKGTREMQNIGDMYDPVGNSFENVIDYKNLPKHEHSIGISMGGMENAGGYDRSVVQGYENRTSQLNGDIGDLGATVNVQNGAVKTSVNLASSSPTDETTHDQLVLEKLPPAIALRYIIKLE